MSNFLQQSVNLLVCGYMAPFKRYKQLRTAFYVSENFCYPEAYFFFFFFFPDAFYIGVEPKLMMPEAVNDVCMPSLCFHEKKFSF